MVSSSSDVAPRETGTSQMSFGALSPTRSRLSLPSSFAKNAIDSPLGDQNGYSASLVPGSSRASGDDNSRSHSIWPLPSGLCATNAIDRPFGDTAGAVLNSSPDGGSSGNRVSAESDEGRDRPRRYAPATTAASSTSAPPATASRRPV